MNNKNTKTALEIAKENVSKENPSLPLHLKFEVSPKEVIDNLLQITDLTLPTPAGQNRNIVGVIFDMVVENLEKNNFKNIQVVRGNPVVSVEDNFDNLFFSPGNPGRSSTYTRYVDGNNMLRAHVTAQVPGTFRSLKNTESLKDFYTFVFPGLAYRRDVIDPRHLDVFHQIDVWTVQENSKYGVVGRDELLKLAETVFEAACPGAEMVVLEAKHPYTLNGIEVYAKIGDKEIEVLEAGLMPPEILQMAGLDANTHSGLALGMGIERLIMARKNLPDIRLIRSTDPRIISQMSNLEIYKDVSNKPAISRDMSFCVDSKDTEEDICENIRNIFGSDQDLLEEVRILNRVPYEKLEEVAKAKLGAKEGQDNILARIILRHPDKTLTKEDANKLYERTYSLLHKGDGNGYV